MHASDLLPAFWDDTFDVKSFMQKYLCVESGFLAGVYADIVKQLAPEYQSYLADLATSGDPNKHPKKYPWNNVTVASDGNGPEVVFLV